MVLTFCRQAKVCLHCLRTEKQCCVIEIPLTLMPRVGENERIRAIGMLQADFAQHVVARC